MSINNPAEPSSPSTPEPLFRGVAVALATFFDAQGAVDVDATAALAAELAQAGLDAILVAGTTGEAGRLSPDERLATVRAVRARLDPSIPVIAGTGDLPADAAIDAATLSRQAIEAGADAVLVLPGATDDPVSLYASIRAEIPTGGRILAYHHPSHRPPGIDLAALCAADVDGVKDSSGDAGRLLDERVRFPHALYTGSAALVFTAGAIGAAGAILAAANLEPRRCLDAFAGDVEAQIALQETIDILRPSAAGAIKARLHERFGTTARCR